MPKSTKKRFLNEKHEASRAHADTPIFTVDGPVLRSLTALQAVVAFRDLLWARAYALGVPTTLVNISHEINTSDGGIDASAAESGNPRLAGDNLLTSGTRFQLKTGAFEPWQPNRIKTELFRRRMPRFENLGAGIQRMLSDGRRFVFVCFGIDPGGEKIRVAEENIRKVFAQCGFPNSQVEVWGQNRLIGMIRDYPSLCLRLRGNDHCAFRFVDSWASDADMQPTAHYGPDRQQLIERLRNELQSGQIHHLRLIGEAGVGKSRLALELARDNTLSSVTLYMRDGKTLLTSSFINELIRSDDHRAALLIVDDCVDRDRKEIWNRLKSRGNRLRLITIDHGPKSCEDDKMRTVVVDAVETELVTEIIKSYDIEKNEAERWAEHCGGSPRLAHMVGENLRSNRPNALQSLAISDVWNRCIVGNDDPNSEEVAIRKLVLLHVSLFKMFGFEPPVDSEAKFITKLITSVRPNFTLAQFNESVRKLKERRILQGGRTLYVSPRLLQIYLSCEYWETYGVSVNIGDVLSNMTPELWNWFVETLRYSHNSAMAERAIDSFLDNGATFVSGDFPNSEGCGRIINVLAESNRKATLRCLKRTIGNMDSERLRRLDVPRQDIVWALQKIAAWEDTFDGAARLLLKLAVAENSEFATNATGTLKQLYSLVPYQAVTKAIPVQRLKLIGEALNSTSSDERKLGLAACDSALDNSSQWRSIGPEYQGLHKKIEPWLPNSYAEWAEAYRSVWELLTSKLDTWCEDERAQLIDTIIHSAWRALHVTTVTQSVVDTLRSVAADPRTNIASLNELLKRQLRHKESKLPGVVKAQLHSICQSLEGHDFASKLRRFVKFASHEDFFGDDRNRTNRVERILDTLAAEAMENDSLILAELPWLVCEDSNTTHYFAWKLSERDNNQRLLSQIVDAYTLHEGTCTTYFLSGYLLAIFNRNQVDWERILVSLSDNSATASNLSDYVFSSGMSENAAKLVINQCHAGKQSKDLLDKWWVAQLLRTLPDGTIEALVRMQLKDGTGAHWNNAVHMLYAYYLEGNKEKALPEELVFDVLTNELLADSHVAHTAAYYWSLLVDALIRQNPTMTWELFERALQVGTRESFVLRDLNGYGEGALTKILRSNPDKAFECIARVYQELDDNDLYGLLRMLAINGHQTIGDDAPGPIQFIPAHTIFNWIDEDIDKRGCWIAGALPLTLDMSVAGRLTRDFVARYADGVQVQDALHSHFRFRGWCGNESDHYRKLRDDAREWLVDERNATVIQWVEGYINYLSQSVESAEIKEEREF